MGNSHSISHWLLLAALAVVLCVAAGLRLHQLPTRPVGLHYDEAANGILAGEIARGLERPLFIASYTGKEVLFFYWAALWMRLLGATTFALRLGAASLGVITIVVTAWAVYELLHDHPDAVWIAVTAAALLAVSFWHLVLSRYGFRAISQPLLQALTVAALWRGLRQGGQNQADATFNVWLLLAGLFCGLTAYTYLAARAFPLPLAAALVTLLVADRRDAWKRLGQSAIFGAVAAVVLAPLVYYWLAHPGSFMTRTRQVAADNLAAVGDGLLACLKMLFLQGDPYIRFNLPGRPLFPPAVAALFVLGLSAGTPQLTRRLRRSGDRCQPLSLAARVFLYTSIPVMLLPSALAAGEVTPSNLRTVGLLPFIYVFPALGLWSIVALLQRLLGREAALTRLLFSAACFLLLALAGGNVASDYQAWSSSPELYYAADGDLADIADYLNRMGNPSDPSSPAVYVASQHYRHPTLAFLARDYETVRWLIGGQTLVFPPEGDSLFLFPRSASGDLDWTRSILAKDTLTHVGLGPDNGPAFHVYRSEMGQAPMPRHRARTNFGQAAQLMGYAVAGQSRSGEPVDITIWLMASGDADQPDYRPVARVADPWHSIWGETQPFHYPSEQWAEGELIVDHLLVPIAPGAPPGDYTVRVGLYAPGADAQLPVLDDSGAYAGLYAELPVHVSRATTSVLPEDMNIDNRIDAAFDGLTLLGTQVDATTARPGEALHATLFWQVGETAPPSYELSLHLGETTLYKGAPVHDTYPFSEWMPGEIIADRYDPRLPLDVSPGEPPLKLQVGDRAIVDLAEITVEATERAFQVPTISHPLTVTLGDQVQLLGYDLSSDLLEPGETLNLRLTWRALSEMTTDYTVFTHLLARDGSMAGQQDRQPVGGSYPTSLWAPREVVADVYEIPVSADAPPGEYHLEVGMYVAETGARLRVEEHPDNAIVIQTVFVTK